MCAVRTFGLQLFAAMFLIGCAADGRIFIPAPKPAPGEGVVYVYRVPGGNQMSVPAIIDVDGKAAATLHLDGYTYFYLEAGHHQLAESPQAALSKARELDVDVPSGGTVYVRLFLGGDSLLPIEQSAVFDQRSDDIAAAEIFRRHLEPGAGARLP